MAHKNPLTWALAFIGLIPLSAYALINLDEGGGGLEFVNKVDATYDSNIEGNRDSDSDMEFTYSPSLQFTRQSGILALNGTLGGTLGRFMDHSEYDYENFRSSFGLKYPNDKEFPYLLSLTGGYNQNSNIDRFLGERVTYDTASLRGSFRYEMNERYGFAVGTSWSETSYDNSSRFADRSYWSMNTDLIYIVSEVLEFNFGYDYSRTSAVLDAYEHALYLRTVGDFTPFITGTLGVGYRSRGGDYGSDGAPLLDIALEWKPTESFAITASATSGYEFSATGASGRNIRSSLGFRLGMIHSISTSFRVGYGSRDYSSVLGTDRTDEEIFVDWGVYWRFNQNMMLSANASYEDWTSDSDRLNYDRVRLGVGFGATF